MTLLSLLFTLGCATNYQFTSIGVQVDYYTQSPDQKSDVLFVVDSSGSMAEEQQKLTTNFPYFFEYLVTQGVDYHIGVVSTDMDDENAKGKLREIDGYTYIDLNT